MSENRAENCEAELVLNWEAIPPIVPLPYIFTQSSLLTHKRTFWQLIQSNHIVKYTHYHYYYEIQGQRFEVANSAAYDALDERFWYRVYYLPRSHRIVNIEPLGMLGYR